MRSAAVSPAICPGAESRESALIEFQAKKVRRMAHGKTCDTGNKGLICIDGQRAAISILLHDDAIQRFGNASTIVDRNSAAAHAHSSRRIVNSQRGPFAPGKRAHYRLFTAIKSFPYF
jgi:hypothetical protein